LIENNFVNAAHDVSDGGLYTALVEMGLPNNLGFDVVSDSEIRMDAFLFGEAQGRIVVTVVEDYEDQFLDFTGEKGVNCTLLGHVKLKPKKILSLVKFIFSKSCLKTLFKAGIGFSLIVALTWLFLKLYTNHGEEILVPNVVNMNIDQASKELSKSNLNFKLIDSTFVKGKEGLIYAQIPKDSSKVKSEREIYLKIYRTIPPQKPVKFKVGEPLEIARTKLLSKGFEVETKYQAGEFNNVVLGAYHGENELSNGDMVGMGEKIRLIVSEKKTTRVNLPDLHGFTLEEVKAALTEASLNVDFPIYHESVLTRTDSIQATVYKQLPDYSSGKKLRAGSTVNVWLKLNSPDEIDNDEFPLDNPND